MVKHFCNVVPSICRASVVLLVVGAGCGGHVFTGHHRSRRQPTWEECVGTGLGDWQDPVPHGQGDPGGQGVETLGVGFIPSFAKNPDGHTGFIRVDRFDTDRVFKGDQRIEILEADHKQLRGADPQGQVLQPEDWIGVRFVGRIRCPRRPSVRDTMEIHAMIVNIGRFQGDPSHIRNELQGAYLYELKLEIKDDHKWKWVDACGELDWKEERSENDEPREVLALRGAFEPEKESYLHMERDGQGTYRRTPYLSFACKKKNAAKCQNMGYLLDEVPGNLAEPKADRVGLFESCVRAMKADYCGTGDSFTINGRDIWVWDNAGIRPSPFVSNAVTASTGGPTTVPPSSPSSSALTFEAAWQSKGTLCNSGQYRIASHQMSLYQRARWPGCQRTLEVPDHKCINEAAAKAKAGSADLVFTAFPPSPPPIPPLPRPGKHKARSEQLGIKQR